VTISDEMVSIADRAYWNKYGTQEVLAVEDGDAESLISMRAALEAALPGLVKAAVHEAYVNAQRAVTEVKWGTGSRDLIRGRVSMQEDAVRAIREAAEENR